METLIAGSRSIKDENKVRELIQEAIQEEEFKITKVISGTAEGVDQFGENWAEENDIPISQYPYEDFIDKESEKPAPLLRNDKMIQEAEQAIVIWDGKSSGTEYVIEKIRDSGVELFLRRTDSWTLGDF